MDYTGTTYARYVTMGAAARAEFWQQFPVTDPNITLMGMGSTPYVTCGGFNGGDASLQCDPDNPQPGMFTIVVGGGSESSGVAVPYDPGADPLSRYNHLVPFYQMGGDNSGGGLEGYGWQTKDYWLNYFLRNGHQWVPVEGPLCPYYTKLYDDSMVAFDHAVGWITPVQNRNMEPSFLDAAFTTAFMMAVQGLLAAGFAIGFADMLTIPNSIAKPLASNFINIVEGGKPNPGAFLTAQADVQIPGSGSILGIALAQMNKPDTPAAQTLVSVAPPKTVAIVAPVTAATVGIPPADFPVVTPVTPAGHLLGLSPGLLNSLSGGSVAAGVLAFLAVVLLKGKT